ncbi:CsbD family protein [Nonomuraea rubra]|uniref:Uncharacterized protein YjbJ (UPF0337 family) n=1 Tax=Nonomuraea rubra TaxID=46180 RepID=A0A7X0P1K2_9ACTN|nr:CsbD family protein [Nonomuraea rubra]MBB6553563.1 uncharacterized protein YjbJ (UPF0337 family) [Nonomuraea rubra]
MSLQWEISNKVQIVKRWARQRFGRVNGNRPRQIAGKSDQTAGRLKQTGGKTGDAGKR